MRSARARRQTTPEIDVFVENLPGNVYRRVRRPDGGYHFEYLSSGLFRQFGVDNERLLAEDTIRFDWVHPDDRARMIADLEVSAATLGLLDHRIRVVGQDARVHWARGIARPSRRTDGSTVWDGIVIDVTREVEAEAALRVAKEEADLAHRTAARLVTDATERLGRPIEDLRRLLDALDTEQPRTGALQRLRSLQAKLSAALGRLAGPVPARGCERPILTPRQQDVHRLLARGLSNKAIAAALRITPGTAKLHVASVLRALDATSRRQLREADLRQR